MTSAYMLYASAKGNPTKSNMRHLKDRRRVPRIVFYFPLKLREASQTSTIVSMNNRSETDQAMKKIYKSFQSQIPWRWTLWRCQWRIQDFPEEGAPTPKSAIILPFFAKNCMKMKEFGRTGGGTRPLRPPLDPPMVALCLRIYTSQYLHSTTHDGSFRFVATDGEP